MKNRLSKRIRTYLYYESARCKPSTIACYRTNLGHFHDWLYQNNPHAPFKQRISGLTGSGLQDYIAYLNGKELAPYTKVNYLLSVKKYLQWEVEHGTLNEGVLSVLDRKQLPKVPEYLPRPLSAENDHLLQERLRRSSSSYAPLFLLLRHAGLRISELINLPTDCVIKTFNGNPFLKVPLGKMNNERLVPLSQGSIELIEKIKTEPPLKSGRRPSGRLIGLSGSIPKVYHLLAYRFKQIVGDLNDQQKPITFHRLRHTYATSLLSAGVGLASLMKLLGHRRIEMTLRYAKVTPSHLRNEYLKAMKIIEGQSPAIASAVASNLGINEHHPADIIANVIAFLNKTSTPPPQKNILRRLKRIHLDLADLSFPQKFKLHLGTDKSMVQ